MAKKDQPAVESQSAEAEQQSAEEEIPAPDPTLSSDNQFSTYTDVTDQFPEGTGHQVEEQPGKASEESE